LFRYNDGLSSSSSSLSAGGVTASKLSLSAHDSRRLWSRSQPAHTQPPRHGCLFDGGALKDVLVPQSSELLAALLHHRMPYFHPNSLRIALLTEVDSDQSRFSLASNGNFALAWHHPLQVMHSVHLQGRSQLHASMAKWVHLSRLLRGGNVGDAAPTTDVDGAQFVDADWFCWLSPHIAISQHSHDWLFSLVASAEDRGNRPVQMILSAEPQAETTPSDNEGFVTDFIAIRNTRWSKRLCDRVLSHPLAVRGVEDTIVLEAVLVEIREAKEDTFTDVIPLIRMADFSHSFVNASISTTNFFLLHLGNGEQRVENGQKLLWQVCTNTCSAEHGQPCDGPTSSVMPIERHPRPPQSKAGDLPSEDDLWV
jgi:hypothetical protein